MFLLEVRWVRSIMPQQSAKDDPEAASTMKAAIITTIGTSMRTGRFVLAASILQLALYVAPGGSGLRQVLTALMEQWSGD